VGGYRSAQLWDVARPREVGELLEKPREDKK
jgi:hypothetical protein